MIESEVMKEEHSLGGREFGLPDGERGVSAGDPRPSDRALLRHCHRGRCAGSSAVWYTYPIRETSGCLLWLCDWRCVDSCCGPYRGLLRCQCGTAAAGECRPAALVCGGGGGGSVIAITTHGYSELQRWVESVTERVLHTTRLPLLIIRPGE